MINDQDFPKLTGGLDKGETGQRRIWYNDDMNSCILSISEPNRAPYLGYQTKGEKKPQRLSVSKIHCKT